MKASIIISVVLFTLIFLFIGHLTISFKPFSISLPYWHRAVGALLLCLGVCMYNVGERAKGYKEGLKDGSEVVIKLLESKINQK